jgi:hypothetical protein
MWVFSKGRGVYARKFPLDSTTSPTLLARHSSNEIGFGDWGRGEGFFSVDSTGEIILWKAPDGIPAPSAHLPKPETASTRLFPDPSGRWLHDGAAEHKLLLWDLTGFKNANPWVLRRRGAWVLSYVDFHPRGTWVIATTNSRTEVSFWPLNWPHPFITDGWTARGFTPNRRFLLVSDVPSTTSTGGLNWINHLRLWPLPNSDSHVEPEDLPSPPGGFSRNRGAVLSPDGQSVITAGYAEAISVIPIAGGQPRRFEGIPARDVDDAVGISPSGRLAAAASTWSQDGATLRVWDLATDEVRIFDQPADPDGLDGSFAFTLGFVDERTLYTAGANGLIRWDLANGSYEVVRRAPPGGFLDMTQTADRRSIIVTEWGAEGKRLSAVEYRDLDTGQTQSVEIPGESFVGFGPDGRTWASVGSDDTIWVGRVGGGEPHALIGHEGQFSPLLISPDEKWIASSSFTDKTLRLWPMPDLSKPPLHTLPHDELIAKLHSLTNLRAVRDEESSTGWKIEVGPFPGWAEVPEW